MSQSTVCQANQHEPNHRMLLLTRHDKHALALPVSRQFVPGLLLEQSAKVARGKLKAEGREKVCNLPPSTRCSKQFFPYMDAARPVDRGIRVPFWAVSFVFTFRIVTDLPSRTSFVSARRWPSRTFGSRRSLASILGGKVSRRRYCMTLVRYLPTYVTHGFWLSAFPVPKSSCNHSATMIGLKRKSFVALRLGSKMNVRIGLSACTHLGRHFCIERIIACHIRFSVIFAAV